MQFLLQQCLIGLTNGALIALVALGYTMVYGIIGLINFAHGDLIMLGACLALSLVGALGLGAAGAAGPAATWLWVALLVGLCGLFCGGLNVAVDRIVYKPLRTAPKVHITATLNTARLRRTVARNSPIRASISAWSGLTPGILPSRSRRELIARPPLLRAEATRR